MGLVAIATFFDVGAAYTVPPKPTAVGRRHAMKRKLKRLSGWIVLAVIALSIGMIGAGEHFPPEGPLGFLYGQIHALFVEVDQLAVKSDDQQEQIDQLTGTVCGLSVLTGNPAPPELCGVVVTAICECDERVRCACDSGPYFDLESCESGSFPHPDFGESPPPKCGTVAGCQGTFTRIAAGDLGSIEVDPNCSSNGSSGGCPAECGQTGCFQCGSSRCCNDCGPL